MIAASTDFSLQPRQTFHSEEATYRVVERVGNGGNSNVYICQAVNGKSRGMLFAAKFMVNVAKADRVARFESELEFLAKTDHPAIIRVFDSGTHTFGPAGKKVDVPFYVSEYLPKTLRDAMRAGMQMLDKVTVAVNILSALMYMSQSSVSIIHRDIKPENIFFRGRAAVLGDFGLLKALDASELGERFDIGKLSGGVRHPYMYPTPELIDYAKDDTKIVTGKSDVFQLGIVLAELFCGDHPIRPRAKPLDPIIVDVLSTFSGSNSLAIRQLVEQMLELDVNRRAAAEDSYDRWEGIFFEVVNDAQRLEGVAYGSRG
ncbi:protein kinase domain-containing protein [Stenotrophomonas maltophilia]|uniref:protein kinase domain-containing protein n=1 Tax=Stenotrophomonas maltophilia TaxID=40324 RepID=UPI003BA302B6